MIPPDVLLKSLRDWAQALEDAESAGDWSSVGHTRRSIQQATLTLERIAQVLPRPE